jgi:hypothetical protein
MPVKQNLLLNELSTRINELSTTKRSGGTPILLLNELSTTNYADKRIEYADKRIEYADKRIEYNETQWRNAYIATKRMAV